MLRTSLALVLAWVSQAAAVPTVPADLPFSELPDAGAFSLLQLRQGIPNAAAGSTQKYVLALAKGSNEEPNPRVACTKGNYDARQTIAKEMSSLGLKPLGTDGSFEWMVDGTAIPGCEHGIANMIGYVQGTEAPDEFLMWVAHLDGPRNQGPSATTLGNNVTDNSYDDVGSVAVGLSLAAALAKDPPRLSVIFFFSGGEEGWDNVGVPPLGSSPFDLTDVAKELCSSGKVPSPNGTDPCRNYPIGFTAWAQKPTVELKSLRLIVDADPLGAPGVAGSDFLAILGTEATPGLQALVEKHWPRFKGATHPIFANRNYAATNYDDVDPLTAHYVCDPSAATGQCLEGGGVPYMWIAQTGFQRYHGGLMVEVTDILVKYGSYIGADFASLTPYYALDRLSASDPAALDRTAATLTPILRALADNTTHLHGLKFNSTPYEGKPTYTLVDAMNNKADVDFLIAALSKGSAVTHIPEDATAAFLRLLQLMGLQLDTTLAFYKYNPFYWGKDPATIYPGIIFQTLAPLIFAVTIGIDFYSVADPNRRVYSGSSTASSFFVNLPDAALESGFKALAQMNHSRV